MILSFMNFFRLAFDAMPRNVFIIFLPVVLECWMYILRDDFCHKVEQEYNNLSIY
jgi:hypothetical protein